MTLWATILNNYQTSFWLALVFGDDPSVNALQEKVSAMLGFEASLFMPSGTTDDE